MSVKPVEILLSPYTLGDLKLRNRIVMAPLTRTRAENLGKVPNELMGSSPKSVMGVEALGTLGLAA